MEFSSKILNYLLSNLLTFYSVKCGLYISYDYCTDESQMILFKILLPFIKNSKKLVCYVVIKLCNSDSKKKKND